MQYDSLLHKLPTSYMCEDARLTYSIYVKVGRDVASRNLNTEISDTGPEARFTPDIKTKQIQYAMQYDSLFA